MISFKDFLYKGESQEGSYVGLRYDEKSCKAIIKLAKEIGIRDIMPKSELHTTLIYSRIPLIGYEIPENTSIYANTKCIKRLGGLTVIELSSKEMEERQRHLIHDCRGMSDFGYYIPHITLSKVPQDIDYDTINAGFVEFEVHAVKEYYETLNMEKNK